MSKILIGTRKSCKTLSVTWFVKYEILIEVILLPSDDDDYTFPTCLLPVRYIVSHQRCTGLTVCVCVCVEIWQVLIPLAGKKREVTLTKEKPRKLRNANSPRQSIHCPCSRVSAANTEKKLKPKYLRIVLLIWRSHETSNSK